MVYNTVTAKFCLVVCEDFLVDSYFFIYFSVYVFGADLDCVYNKRCVFAAFYLVCSHTCFAKTCGASLIVKDIIKTSESNRCIIRKFIRL